MLLQACLGVTVDAAGSRIIFDIPTCPAAWITYPSGIRQSATSIDVSCAAMLAWWVSTWSGAVGESTS
jgi:hypothetical protein